MLYHVLSAEARSSGLYSPFQKTHPSPAFLPQTSSRPKTNKFPSRDEAAAAGEASASKRAPLMHRSCTTAGAPMPLISPCSPCLRRFRLSASARPHARTPAANCPPDERRCLLRLLRAWAGRGRGGGMGYGEGGGWPRRERSRVTGSAKRSCCCGCFLSLLFKGFIH